jgi:hypothetical protein
MGGLDVSRLSSASAKDDSRGPDPNRGGNNRRTARTSSRLDRRPASCRAGSKVRVRRRPPSRPASSVELTEA